MRKKVVIGMVEELRSGKSYQIKKKSKELRVEQ